MAGLDPLAMALADVDGNADPERPEFAQTHYGDLAAAAREYLRYRPWTPDRVNLDGTKTVRVVRACNGCGRPVGDVTDAELDAWPLPDVRAECGCHPLPLGLLDALAADLRAMDSTGAIQLDQWPAAMRLVAWAEGTPC